MTNANPNIAVQLLGQSFWYDNIQRSLISSGELKRLIDDFGVLGVTSNPSIFEKAIAQSADYDAQMIELAAGPLDTKGVYERLAIQDIQGAADLLRPVFDQTNGRDGYVSLEVSPDLAHDMRGTLDEARRLFKTVERPNLMIKVPATPECIPAIEQLIAEGIHVNVTLIFSLDGYERVARAYLAGLTQRAKKGLPLTIASVASFFVSRVDTLVDKLLDERIAAAANAKGAASLQALKHKAAIANARLAYEVYERLFSGPEWQALEAHNARPQRVLWASTSAKNPSLPDTYYADALIGKDTVNTLPPATLKAFRDHGRVVPTLKHDLKGARAVVAGLEAAGIAMPQVWQQLQDEGVQLFADAFHGLLRGIEGRRRAVLARGAAQGVAPAAGYIDELVKLKAATRVWSRDPALWTSEPEHIKVIANRLGWLTSIDLMQTRSADLRAFADEIKAAGITHAVVLGMGGSSLAPEMFRAVFGSEAAQAGWPITLHVLDTTDPETIRALDAKLDLRHTLFIVASKSGGTQEVTSFYEYYRAQMDALLRDDAGRHFVAITDDGTSLQSLAVVEKFRRTFINPGDIGGRYSALSYFGLLPAALAGVDVAKLLSRAAQMAEWCKPDSAINPGLYLGALLGGMGLAGRDKLIFLISPGIEAFGLWVEQLIAESTGKQGRGLVPVIDDLINLKNVTELSKDRLYVSLRLGADTSHDRLAAHVRRGGLPLINLGLEDIYDLGAEIFRWEFATAIAGVALGVDPFDEPNVTESKTNTKRLLDEFEIDGVFASEATSRSANSQIGKHARSAREGDYIVVQAYVPYDEKTADLLLKLRAALGTRTKAPITMGFGPRFLHSTGQLHKGGPNRVVAYQLTYDVVDDLPIPGEPYTFGTLMRAQALGDFESLKTHERRVVRIHLGNDVAAGLRKAIRALRGNARPARPPAPRKTAATESPA